MCFYRNTLKLRHSNLFRISCFVFRVFFLAFSTVSLVCGPLARDQVRAGSSLELEYLLLYNDRMEDLRGKSVAAGSVLFVQVRYDREGFPSESLTTVHIEIFDAGGNRVLRDMLERPMMEGTRLDRYRFKVPPEASGRFLVVVTVRVNQGQQNLAEVTKTIPFEILTTTG